MCKYCGPIDSTEENRLIRERLEKAGMRMMELNAHFAHQILVHEIESDLKANRISKDEAERRRGILNGGSPTDYLELLKLYTSTKD